MITKTKQTEVKYKQRLTFFLSLSQPKMLSFILSLLFLSSVSPTIIPRRHILLPRQSSPPGYANGYLEVCIPSFSSSSYLPIIGLSRSTRHIMHVILPLVVSTSITTLPFSINAAILSWPLRSSPLHVLLNASLLHLPLSTTKIVLIPWILLLLSPLLPSLIPSLPLTLPPQLTPPPHPPNL